MDHAINQLREYMRVTASLYKDLAVEDVREKMESYVDVLNIQQSI